MCVRACVCPRQLNGCEIRKGRKVGVTISHNNHRLFVGNIPKNRDGHQLYQDFDKFARKSRKESQKVHQNTRIYHTNRYNPWTSPTILVRFVFLLKTFLGWTHLLFFFFIFGWLLPIFVNLVSCSRNRSFWDGTNSLLCATHVLVLFVFIKSSLILDYAYIFGYRLYWMPITNVNLFRRKKKLEILAFQRFSMRRIACHYLSLILFSLYFFPPLTRDQTFAASTISWPLFGISIILFLFCLLLRWYQLA